MDDCCSKKEEEIAALARGGRRRVLQVVIAINVTMFVVELGAGIAARSTAMMADSVDMLGDGPAAFPLSERSSLMQRTHLEPRGVVGGRSGPRLCGARNP